MPKSAERCREIREEARAKILHDAMLYFARNGFAGTKISDLYDTYFRLCCRNSCELCNGIEWMD